MKKLTSLTIVLMLILAGCNIGTTSDKDEAVQMKSMALAVNDHEPLAYPNMIAPTTTSTVYIDSEFNGGSNNGSISNPYINFSAVTNSNNELDGSTKYLIKSGSYISRTAPLRFSNDNIEFNSYGEGAKPIVHWQTTQYSQPFLNLNGAEFFAIYNIHIKSTGRHGWGIGMNSPAEGQISTNHKIMNCEIENMNCGVFYHIPSGNTRNVWVENIWVEGCVMHNLNTDGVAFWNGAGMQCGGTTGGCATGYLRNLVIKGNHMYNCSWAWMNDLSGGDDVCHNEGNTAGLIFEDNILDKRGISGQGGSSCKYVFIHNRTAKAYNNDPDIVCNLLVRNNTFYAGNSLIPVPTGMATGTSAVSLKAKDDGMGGMDSYYDTIWFYGNHVIADQYDYLPNQAYGSDEAPGNSLSYVKGKVMYVFDNYLSGQTCFGPTGSGYAYIINNTFVTSGNGHGALTASGNTHYAAIENNVVLIPNGNYFATNSSNSNWNHLFTNGNNVTIQVGAASNHATGQFWPDMNSIGNTLSLVEANDFNLRPTESSSLVNPSTSNYELDMTGWPSIITDDLAAGRTDADGNVRDSNHDIGCYEYGGTVIPQPPVANFTSSEQNIDEGQMISFTDLSINNPTTWEWIFEGGNPGASLYENPTNITYEFAGDWDVSLTVTNLDGSDTETKVGYIHVDDVVIPNPPIANFLADNLNPTTGTSVDFTDISSNNPTSWLWSFAPSTITYSKSTSATSQHPSLMFNNEGFYDVTLLVSNADGSSTKTKDNYIHVEDGTTPCDTVYEIKYIYINTTVKYYYELVPIKWDTALIRVEKETTTTTSNRLNLK